MNFAERRNLSKSYYGFQEQQKLKVLCTGSVNVKAMRDNDNEDNDNVEA
jgi:hypothetical protein